MRDNSFGKGEIYMFLDGIISTTLSEEFLHSPQTFFLHRSRLSKELLVERGGFGVVVDLFRVHGSFFQL